ncbi:MAG: GNAT family N-acetyltransferase [bacterium]
MKTRELAFQELKNQKVFQVESYSESKASEWDEFVVKSNNGTLFHTRRFINYHPPDRFTDASLIFKKDNKWMAVLPAVVKQIDGHKRLISHAGASMAGPAFRSTLSFKDTFRLVESLLDYAQRNACNQIQITLPPQIYHWRPSNYLDFALLDFGFTYQKREVSSVIPLDFAEEDTLLIFSPESRRAVRKALKLGVQVQESDDFGAFYVLLKKNLQLRHHVQPTHTLQELVYLKSLFPDEIRLFTAQANNQIAAGILIFICNKKVALAFYVSHDEKLQNYRSVNLLFYEAFRWCIRRQLKFLDFGIFTVNMKPNWGLAKFKESFGAQGVFRDTFVKTL